MLPYILRIFSSRSKLFYVFLLALTLLSTALNMGIIAFINNIISGKRLPIFYTYGWAFFLAMITVSVVLNKTFQTYLVRLTNNILYDIEIALLEKLRKATYQSFEKLGAQRVFTAIGDLRVIGRIPHHFISAFNAVTILLCCLIYLFIISPPGMISMLVLMSGLLVFYMIRNKKIERSLNRLRNLMNDYFRYLHDLLLGFKELKMSTTRNNNLYNNYLKQNRTEGRDLTIETSVSYLNNEIIGNYSWYLVIGVILFVLPPFLLLSSAQIVSMLLLILYMMGPVAVLTSMVQAYTNVKIAIERINQFERDVSIQLKSEIQNGSGEKLNSSVDSIEFRDVTFEFEINDEEAGDSNKFVLGPINITINRNEVIFLTGGNGSGKSTFVNLLTGLYRPTSGDIYFNGHKVTEESYSAYSNLISAIFTNHHMFDENYNGFELSGNNKRLIEYLKWMQIKEVVKINEDKNCISSDLSKGQQKRLALIYSLMEEREIIILDEWAAEQDPEFRAYFYESLLPRFKQMGKTIVAVTHDDAYYAYADRIIKFDFGKVVSDEVLEAQVTD